MTDVLEQYKKECEEMKLAAMVWWLILWHASREGELEIPAQEEWLTCELIAALMEEVTGEKFQYSWQHDDWGHERTQTWGDWQQYLNRQMDDCRVQHPSAFNESIEGQLRSLLARFARYEFQAVQNEKDWVSELRTLHEDFTPRPSGRSRFKPSHEMYVVADAHLHKIQKSFHWWGEVSEWYRQIARLMRPYVERDVAFIKRHRPL